jgi:hypothetical protein
MSKTEQLDLLAELRIRLENLEQLLSRQMEVMFVPARGRTPGVVLNDMMAEQAGRALECVQALREEIRQRGKQKGAE